VDALPILAYATITKSLGKREKSRHSHLDHVDVDGSYPAELAFVARWSRDVVHG
jgi:hypothetical protein